ncbi:hypothetical protein GCM10018966_095600 [Streptomyces yanii]
MEESLGGLNGGAEGVLTSSQSPGRDGHSVSPLGQDRTAHAGPQPDGKGNSTGAKAARIIPPGGHGEDDVGVQQPVGAAVSPWAPTGVDEGQPRYARKG